MDDKGKAVPPPIMCEHDPRLELRYLVIKLSDLSESQLAKIQKVIANRKIPVRNGVFCEADWPMYDDAVNLILPKK